MENFTIIGGGIAGLSLGFFLKEKVTIIEKNEKNWRVIQKL